MPSRVVVELSGDDDKLAFRLKGLEKYAMQNLNIIFHIFIKKGTNLDVILPFINIKKHYSLKPIPASIKFFNELEDTVYVSAGDTRKITLYSKIIIKTSFPNIHPVLANTFPKKEGHFVLLDLGASLWPDDEDLFPWIAFAGRSMAKTLFGKAKMGLLNIGEEFGKGGDKMEKIRLDLLELFKEEFIGNMEMHYAVTNDINVLLTSGFLGNLTIKTFEGTLRLMKEKVSIGSWKKLTGFGFKTLFKMCWSDLYWKYYSGAYLLGFKKPILSTHGASDSVAFYYALKRACDPKTQKIFSAVNDDPEISNYCQKPANHFKVNLDEKLQCLEEQKRQINQEIKTIKRNLEHASK